MLLKCFVESNRPKKMLPSFLQITLKIKKKNLCPNIGINELLKGRVTQNILLFIIYREKINVDHI